MADIHKLEIKVIREECIGDGACCDDAPNTFKLDNDGIAIVNGESTDDQETILTAARNCPTDAIVVAEKASGKQLVPEG
ncbi:ferredoxin [Myxococcota bacterium]